ncbi:MAG: hypothetical protein GF331_10555 [Chitinivibrionales bacterium]|nr:hypothetical protein [Chitinivibrionales bacterium]
MSGTQHSADEIPQALRGGFSLKSVCWGYRDIFAEALRGLARDGLIGEGREEVTRELLDFLKIAETNECFAHVLKEFLLSLNDHTAWTMKLPGIFSDVVEMGRRLAERRISHGITYFTLFGQGAFGSRPAQVRCLMRWLRRLDTHDAELALAFLKHHGRLITRLAPDEVDLYIDEGIALYTRNHRQGVRFMEGTVKAAESVIQTLSRECRLSDVRAELATLLRALTGIDVEVDGLSALDSDDLLECGARFVCLYRWVYLPDRLRAFGAEDRNHAWYLLQAVIAAGMLSQRSFPVLHGHPAFPNVAALTGESIAAQNLFHLIEYRRVLTAMRNAWPGCRRLLRFGIDAELDALPVATAVDTLARECIEDQAPSSPLATLIATLAARSTSLFESASLIDEAVLETATARLPDFARVGMRSFGFLPDFRFTAHLSEPPSDSVIADLKQPGERSSGGEHADSQRRREAAQQSIAGSGDGEQGKPGTEALPRACYLYDEWSEAEGDYYPNYCSVHELVPEPRKAASREAPLHEEAARVRRVFELLKPDAVRREKYLEHGDTIAPDQLVAYLVERRRDPSPRVRFYEKPRVLERSLALLVLLDVSGSTGESSRHERFIDIQKHAAVVLGEGLEGLGDRFAICGFSGNGRENCEYFVYKDFDEPWNETCRARVMAAAPRSSTRIGPALRHSGYRLQRLEARTRLVILISDGRPMDSGYDPSTRYAQYDVRMACKENRHHDIHTFCITTNENTVADMEIMFPENNYAILPHIRSLPAVLPRLYLRLTT